jgi:flagellar basal body rod protein FlgB
LPEGEFSKALEEALEERRTVHPNEFVMKDSKSIEYPRGGYLPKANMDNGKEWGPERHDENSVVIEKEMGDLAKNTLFIQTMQRLLAKKYTMMRSALRDRVA